MAASPRRPRSFCSEKFVIRPELLQHGEPPVLGDGDAGRLLSSMLERVQREVGEPRDVAIRRVDAEDAAHQPTVPISISSMPDSLSTSPGAQARIADALSGTSTSAAMPLQRAACSTAR